MIQWRCEISPIQNAEDSINKSTAVESEKWV
jgi:hypothetical protein